MPACSAKGNPAKDILYKFRQGSSIIEPKDAVVIEKIQQGAECQLDGMFPSFFFLLLLYLSKPTRIKCVVVIIENIGNIATKYHFLVSFYLPLLSISTQRSPPKKSLGSFEFQSVKSTGVPSVHLQVEDAKLEVT